MSDHTQDRRLPPPAFPPGSRKYVHTKAHQRPFTKVDVPRSASGAFISPDEPLPPRRGTLGAAFVASPEQLRARGDGVEEGVVTGMGDDPHLDRKRLVSAGDPHLMEVIGAVDRLAEALKRKGRAGLNAPLHASAFEATLRAYCLGYLKGRKADDESV
jgi:hypothetical protein